MELTVQRIQEFLQDLTEKIGDDIQNLPPTVFFYRFSENDKISKLDFLPKLLDDLPTEIWSAYIHSEYDKIRKDEYDGFFIAMIVHLGIEDKEPEDVLFISQFQDDINTQTSYVKKMDLSTDGWRTVENTPDFLISSYKEPFEVQ